MNHEERIWQVMLALVDKEQFKRQGMEVKSEMEARIKEYPLKLFKAAEKIAEEFRGNTR